MSDVRNCKRCNRLFNFIGNHICPYCIQEDEDNFKKVKLYLYDNPKATIYDVSKELDISIQLLKKYLREGRLEIMGTTEEPSILCQHCGEPIPKCRYCARCAKSFTNNLQSATKEMTKKKSIGMRYLNKDD